MKIMFQTLGVRISKTRKLLLHRMMFMYQKLTTRKTVCLNQSLTALKFKILTRRSDKKISFMARKMKVMSVRVAWLTNNEQ